MSNLSAKTTIYLDPNVKKFIRHKAVAEDRSLSDIINDQFAEMLEDLDDIKEIKNRRGEPSIPFEDVLKDLSITYEQLRN